MFKQKIKLGVGLSWAQILTDASEEREKARKRVRSLSGVIRDVKRRLSKGEDLGALAHPGRYRRPNTSINRA